MGGIKTESFSKKTITTENPKVLIFIAFVDTHVLYKKSWFWYTCHICKIEYLVCAQKQ
jgi:hypothetical protein